MKKAVVFAGLFAGMMLGGLRADQFDVTFTALTSQVQNEPSDLRDLLGSFDTDATGKIVEIMIGIEPDPWLLAWYIGPQRYPCCEEKDEGVLAYDSSTNSLDGELTSFGLAVLVIHSDGTWWANGGGSIFETGIYSVDGRPVTGAVPEPATWCLLGSVLLCCAAMRRAGAR